MGDWFHFSTLGMDGMGIKSERQLIWDIHESSTFLNSLQHHDHMTNDINHCNHMKAHHPKLYTQRKKELYKVMHPILKPNNPFEIDQKDHFH